MNKQDEEKALKLADLQRVPDEEDRYFIGNRCEVYDKCLEMSAWKEEQMIEKVYQLLVEKYFFTEDEAKDFKQAMEGD